MTYIFKDLKKDSKDFFVREFEELEMKLKYAKKRLYKIKLKKN